MPSSLSTIRVRFRVRARVRGRVRVSGCLGSSGIPSSISTIRVRVRLSVCVSGSRLGLGLGLMLVSELGLALEGGGYFPRLHTPFSIVG